MVLITLITIVNGIYKPTYNWGASHCSHDQHGRPRSDPFNVGFHPAINHPATDLATNVTNDIPFLGVYQQTNQLTN